MPIQIEIFSSPGCGKCGHAKQILKKLVEQSGTELIRWREVNILEELDYAVSLGVLSTPAIAIDGELVFTRLPSSKALQYELDKRMGDTTA